MPLKPEYHPNLNLFVPAIFDNTAFKDDMASMEHPFFTLSKNKDMRVLRYERENVVIEIKPSVDGLPTIMDKDILLYCVSLMMKEINEGRIPPKTMRISSHDLLVATNRTTDGRGYRLLKQSLDRLVGVKVKTNIKTNKREQISAFGFLESYNIIESSKVKNRMVRLEITLSDWFYNSVLGKEVLTLHRDYFRLGRPLERRLYELARKHCGGQQKWEIYTEHLWEKSGSASPLKKFRHYIKQIVKDNHLPDYRLSFNQDTDIVSFKPCKEDIPAVKQAKAKKRKEETPQTSLNFGREHLISDNALEKAKKLNIEARAGWDIYGLQEEFLYSIENSDFNPQNIDGAFINYIKKKVKQKA